MGDRQNGELNTEAIQVSIQKGDSKVLMEHDIQQEKMRELGTS